MKIYCLERSQIVHTSLAQAWDFFSKPENLKEITPSYMDFEITSEHLGQVMYPGMIVTYIVRPLLGLPIHWVTEITQVETMKFFVDEQRVGPYRLWHHQHFFREVRDGVEVVDLVHYAPPFGLLGRFMHYLFIKRQLNTIFDYRFEVVESLFNAKER